MYQTRKINDKQSGFSFVEVLLFVLVIAVLTVIGLVVYKHLKPSSTKSGSAINQTLTTTKQQGTVTPKPQHNPYQGWDTYSDTGYAAASGISIQYPTDWQIHIPGVKNVGNTANPAAVINERAVFLSSSETPQEEWNTCATNVSTDACGAAPGDKTLSSNESTINGLAAYTATMQNSYGTYHVTVMRGNKLTQPAGTPFVEFTTTSNDQTALNTYAEMMASATFPN